MRVAGTTLLFGRGVAWRGQATSDFLRRCRTDLLLKRRHSVFSEGALERLAILSNAGWDNCIDLRLQQRANRPSTIKQKVHRALASGSQLCEGGRPTLTPEPNRGRGWKKRLKIITVFLSSLLASLELANADELLYLSCDLSGAEMSEGQSKSYSDTVIFKVDLQTNEAWEGHAGQSGYYNHLAAEIDESAIRLFRADEGDLRSSDVSYRIDRRDGSIVFTYRVTWYDSQTGDEESLTLATGTCKETSTPPPVR